MTLHVSAQRWHGNQARGGFRTRNEGFSQAKRTWKCQRCRAEHREKPKTCAGWPGEDPCGSTAFWYFNGNKHLKRARALLMLYDAGEIDQLEFEVPYPFVTVHMPTGKVVPTGVTYRADNRYRVVATGETVVEDVKPNSEKADDPLFKAKRKHFEAQYGIELQIVRKV